MPDKQSVTGWLQGLQAGDEAATDALWRRYFEQLVRLARQRLGDSPRRVADEQDVATSVFKSLCEGVERGEFDRLNDREDLWRLIAAITARKADQQVRWLMRQKRGGGQVRGDSVFLKDGSENEGAGFDGFVLSPTHWGHELGWTTFCRICNKMLSSMPGATREDSRSRIL